MAGFDYFVILAGMRTGSNFLEANLNALPGVRCYGEAFNPHFIGHKGQETLLDVPMTLRAEDPMLLVRRMIERTRGLPGFRFFHDHDPRVLARCLPDPRCAKIVLTRNPVESFVSLKIAAETGQWKLGDLKHHRSATVRFDPAEFERHLETLQDFQLRILNGLQVTGQTAFWIAYEDIGDLDVLNGLARFLGVEERLAQVHDGLKKQNPEPLPERVVNPAEMEAALARLDRFNLWRTPNFEPRRAPGVPGYLAAARAPLLYLPVRAGPEARVAGWLAAVDGGQAPQGDFTQKTLRQWQRAHPGHRSFTVLRHPLARAHAAFCRAILGGLFPEIRRILRKSYRLPLPEGDVLPGALPPGYGPAEHRAGFLAFLRWLKGNLAGQTSVRVDPLWASQTAVVQGFAQVVPPDMILREDRLDAGLAALAAEVGLPPAAPPPEDEAAPVALSEVYDPEVEAAAREAYARDYLGFGFADWRG